MIEMDLQLFGGRGSSSGGGGGSRGGGGAPKKIEGGAKTGDFTEVSEGRYESDKKVITAAGGSASSLESRYEIVKGEYKGQTVYRAYENGLNHRQFLFRSNTPQEAVKKLNK